VDKTTSDRLAIAAEQLQFNADRLRQDGITADEVEPVVVYISALTDHCHEIASLTLCAIRDADPDHPVRRRIGVECALTHVRALSDAAIHFAGDAEEDIRSMHCDDTL
jgi:hypothetical protein